MKLNNHGKIEFLPSNEINFYKNSFEVLYTFKKNPLVNISYNKKHDQIMENSNNDDLLFTPESKNKKRKIQYIKYSAIGLLIIVLIGSIYFFSDNYLSNQKLKEIEIAQKKIKSNVQKATFDIGKLSKVELNVNSNNSNKVANLSSNEKYFSVIAGSFRSINNAENKLNSLIKEGYKAEMAKKVLKGFIGLHMVDLFLRKGNQSFNLSNILFKKRLGFLRNNYLHFINPIFRILWNCIIENTKLQC